MINLTDAAISGTGIYTIPEAAKYARMSPATLRSWFWGGKDRQPLHPNQIDSPDFKAISFLDLIEAVAIRSLRVDYQISFQKFREAVKTARDRYGVDHPFAQQRRKTILIGRDLHIFLDDDSGNPVQITGRNVGQESFRTCIEAYMQDLTFDEKGIVNLYRAFHFNGQDIVLTPKIHFGDPIVRENGYTAQTLYKAAIAEGSIKRAAEIYEASVESVEAAYRYCNQELGLAA
jgi:uncharacterized protein (DUF433 family)